MMRSLLRGLGRGALPNRSRSARGPPVCMSSMAQQARPKSRYHTLLARAQLRSQLSALSTVVLMTEPETSSYWAAIPFGGAFSGLATVSFVLRRSCRAARGVLCGFFHLGRRPTFDGADPLEVPLGPDVDEAEDEDGDEGDDLEERDHALP